MPSTPGCLQHYSDMAMTTVLMLKPVSGLPLRALQGLGDSIITLMKVTVELSGLHLLNGQSPLIFLSKPQRGVKLYTPLSTSPDSESLVKASRK
ncbi:transposase [Serratia sp. T13T92]|uniref:transposase n=1 Tax=Serratia sp. T13T92 TaxID=3397496 RepID=UPI0039E14858